MHEISLVQNLLEQLENLAREHGKTRVIRVTMEIGPHSGVVVDSFRFGFESLVDLKPLTKEATLEILTPPARYRCLDCGHVADGKQPDQCNHCDGTLFFPEGGNDLILQQVEME